MVTGLFVGSGAYDSHESARVCLLRCTPQACVYGGEAPTNYQREQILRAPEIDRDLMIVALPRVMAMHPLLTRNARRFVTT